MNEITLEGKRYRLTPIEDEKEPKVEEKKVLDDYLGWKKPLEVNTETTRKVVTTPNTQKGVVLRAKPQVYGYRERFKKKQVHPSELVAPQRLMRPIRDPHPDPQGGISRQAGYDPWIGEGTEIDII